MLIESLIRRAAGTFIQIEKEIYNFDAHIDGDERHVCSVENEDHIQTFLAIREGFRIFKKKPAPAAQTTAPAGARQQTKNTKSDAATTAAANTAQAAAQTGSTDNAGTAGADAGGEAGK